MDAADVIDRETLRDYLRALPADAQRQIGRRVAFNAAARVLPIAARDFLTTEWARKGDLTPVAVFGALTISAVARELQVVETWFTTAADAAADAAYAAASDAADAAAYAASAAAYAVADAASDVAFDAAASASDAAAAWDIDLWVLIRDDLAAVGPVWPDGMPDMASDAWDAAQSAMANHPADWSIWIHLYNRILHQRPWHPAAMWDVLKTITRDDWEKGPTHINPMFDEVLAVYLAEDEAELKPSLEIARGEPEQILKTKTAMEFHRRELPGNLDAILGYISLEIQRLQDRNHRSDDERDEAKRQIGVLTSLHEAVVKMSLLVPENAEMPQDDAVTAEGLVRFYAAKFKEWPRKNADEMVDNTCRFALVGLSAMTLPMLGVSATVATVAGAAFFGGDRILKNIKAAKDALK